MSRYLKIICALIIFSNSFLGHAVPKNTFRWAADIGSGAPNVFQDPSDPHEIIGFEKEIIEAVAEKVGLKLEFVKNEWNVLLLGLQNNLYDVVINSCIISEEREAIVDFSIPYYVGYQKLAINAKHANIHKFADLSPKHVVGVLRNTPGAKLVLEKSVPFEVRIYTAEINLFKDLARGKLDGVLIDEPIAKYYGSMEEKIRFVEEPIGIFEYGIAVNKKNRELLQKLNIGLQKIIADGTLRRIYDRWDLWNESMANYFDDHRPAQEKAVAFEEFKGFYSEQVGFLNSFKKYLKFTPLIIKGAINTLEISVCAMILAMSLGMVFAIMRIYGNKYLQFMAKTYIEVLRGTPLLVQLYFIFYGLPNINVHLNPFIAGVIALGLNYSAYEAENYRAGILSVPKGQMEAARALGMTHWQGLRYVILPQAFRTSLLPLTNDFISLLKDSSLVSVITIVELTFIYDLLATTYYNYFGVGVLIAGIYFLIGLPFVQLSRWAERKMSFDKKNHKMFHH